MNCVWILHVKLVIPNPNSYCRTWSFVFVCLYLVVSSDYFFLWRKNTHVSVNHVFVLKLSEKYGMSWGRYCRLVWYTKKFPENYLWEFCLFASIKFPSKMVPNNAIIWKYDVRHKGHWKIQCDWCSKCL